MENTNLESTQFCAVCKASINLKRCGYCKSALYCSREHQMKDWIRHKSECLKMKKKLENESTNLNKESEANGVESKDVKEDKNTKTKSLSNNKHTNSAGQKSHCQTKCDNDTGHNEAVSKGIPFDSRPYACKTFLKMEPNTDDDKIAGTAVKYLKSHGYCVIDGIFTEDQITRALIDINRCREGDKFNSGRLAGGRTSSERDKQVVNSHIRSDEILWVEGYEQELPGIKNIVSKMDEILTTFNKYLIGEYSINGRTKVMLACYPGNGTFYRRHIDNPNKDGRVVTCILYLNRGWDVKDDGGLLRLLPAESDDHIDIAPVANRLLFFWSDRRNPHEVHPAFKTRYAITVWYMDEDERRKAKEDMEAEDAKGATTRGEYSFEDLQMQKLETRELQLQMDGAASQAVASLSLDELQALSMAISGQPDPEAVLERCGIAPCIRDKLLERLQTL